MQMQHKAGLAIAWKSRLSVTYAKLGILELRKIQSYSIASLKGLAICF